MSLGNSVNKLNFDPILINSILTKLSPDFHSFFIELSLNWYKIVSQILQKLSLKLYNIVTDTSFVSVY